ncbi:hypothetical protein HID58_096049 [Brassica napus]|uniref:CoA carboxyltransferase N-terminal domain-containing protein n=1 Tax=Brassica napus TaxID=3708 RepID=A0ABQ7X1L7_BRANA|nr:hypothetical protein HID58_096049 [Brassica napus]
MEKSWFNLMFSKGELEYRGELSKAMDSFAPIEKTTISKDRLYMIWIKIYGWGERSSYYNNVDLLVNSKDIRNFISDDTFFLCSSSYLNNRSKGDNDLHYDPYIKDTKYNCNNHINSCIDSYFRSHICINIIIPMKVTFNFICSESGSGKIRESKNDKIRTNSNRNNLMSSKDFDITKNYNQLWIQCDNCYGLIRNECCEECGHYLKMTSSERIELSIDPGIGILWMKTWSLRIPLNFIRGRTLIKAYCLCSKKTGLTDAIQTGTGQLNGIPVALGVMDFQFMGGSMGSVVGEKITRLIEYATNQLCSSGGARMQEGSLIILYINSYISYYRWGDSKFWYVGGYHYCRTLCLYCICGGKRVIEQTLKKAVPEGSQAAESLLRKGLLDAIVPRNPLKGVVSELFQLHAFFSLTK